MQDAILYYHDVNHTQKVMFCKLFRIITRVNDIIEKNCVKLIQKSSKIVTCVCKVNVILINKWRSDDARI